jgi:ABC-2 type transport system permease protein
VRVAPAAARLQLQLVASDFNYVMPLVLVPLTTMVFFAIIDHAGRTDLAPYSLFAPALDALWTLSLFVSGDMVDVDRALGVLETVVATPARFADVVLARVLAVTSISLLAFAEVWIVARLLFAVPVHVHHPALLAAALATTAFAMSGTAVVMAAFFVHSRNARIFQNSLSYPFYVLGGVMVPVALLPSWLQPVSKIVFLSWAAEALRASVRRDAGDASFAIVMVVALGIAGYGAGWLLLKRLLARARRSGELALW